MDNLVYSFRAECPRDIEEFQSECKRQGIDVTLDIQTPEITIPDRYVEMQSSAELEVLRNLMRAVDDGHVMVSTLRPVPLKDNSLERDWKLEY